MKLKSVSLEYDGGTTKTISLNELDSRVQASLSDAGLCEPIPEIVSARHYLVLEWKDGWKEVMAVNSAVADVIRYFVIRRIEDRGRLALDVGGEYPELLILERCPAELARIFITGDNGTKSVELSSELESYEGIFESGGKREYKKYDRGMPAFKDKLTTISSDQAGLEKAINEAVNKTGQRPDEVLGMDQGRRVQEYRKIAKAAGLQGLKRQSDVYGLIESVLQKRAGTKTSAVPRE